MKWLSLFLWLVQPALAQLLPTEEIARIACQRSRVVMMNEAHDGLRRLART